MKEEKKKEEEAPYYKEGERERFLKRLAETAEAVIRLESEYQKSMAKLLKIK